ncbi:matrix metalloproteinase-2 isoform X1, partial [Vespula maculifrons]
MAVYGRHHFTQRTKFRYRGAKNSGYRAEKMRSSGVDTLTKINHPQFSSRCVCSSSFRFPVSDRRMDVPIVGKSELGGKYEAGIRRRRRRHLDCRHWQRRRKRRKGGDGGGGGGGKLTEVCRYAIRKRKRERKRKKKKWREEGWWTKRGEEEEEQEEREGREQEKKRKKKNSVTSVSGVIISVGV